jgi:phosphohistidine phosphatase
MNLFILRHASAGTRRPNPVIDLKRSLDKEGKEHCLHLAHVLNALKVSFDCVVSSPLKRSLQTAQLVATETGFEKPIVASDALAPAAKFADFKKLLDEYQTSENLLVVGHSPNIQEFLGALLVPRVDEAKPAQIRMRKGSIARVSLTKGPAVLQSVLDPRTVKAVYRTSQATSTKRSRPKTSRK